MEPCPTRLGDDEMVEAQNISPVELTRMLKAWRAGDPSALEELTPVVYSELHRIAQANLAREREGHILQPSALVNEAFLRLMGNATVDWESRAHFFAVSARVMRRTLINIAHAQLTEKRGRRSPHVALAQAGDIAATGANPSDFIDLDQALEELSKLDERQAQVVELRYFGGLENAEVAAVLGISEPTVIRDWRAARAWLYNRLRRE
jgi:RNA polymerase sigma factor (TIGR02999 family)